MELIPTTGAVQVYDDDDDEEQVKFFKNMLGGVFNSFLSSLNLQRLQTLCDQAEDDLPTYFNKSDGCSQRFKRDRLAKVLLLQQTALPEFAKLFMEGSFLKQQLMQDIKTSVKSSAKKVKTKAENKLSAIMTSLAIQ